MKHYALAAFAALLLAAPMALAAPRKTKPVVCLSWDVAQSKGRTYAVCRDGDKPFIFVSANEVTIEDSDGNPVRILVGYR